MSGNPFEPHLEALDRKTGRVHTVADWHRVCGKVAHTPAAVMEDDLVVLAYFEGEKAAESARARRALAINGPPLPPETSPEPPQQTAVNADKANKLVSRGYLEKVLTHEADGLWTELVKVIKPMLERIAALEAKPHVKFCGVYESGRSYTPGDACVHGGGLWICKAATMGQPNQDYAGWTLAVKSRGIT